MDVASQSNVVRLRRPQHILAIYEIIRFIHGMEISQRDVSEW